MGKNNVLELSNSHPVTVTIPCPPSFMSVNCHDFKQSSNSISSSTYNIVHNGGNVVTATPVVTLPAGTIIKEVFTSNSGLVQNNDSSYILSQSVIPDMRNEHSSNKPVTVGEQLENGKWRCTLCPSTYKHKPHLSRHMRTHLEHKPYTCNFCHKEYFRKDNFQIHLKSHSEEKPFVCSYCSKKFLRKNNFERHTRLHTGEKPYACPYCLHRSIRKDTLEGHVYRNHTRDLKNIDRDDLTSSSDDDNPS